MYMRSHWDNFKPQAENILFLVKCYLKSTLKFNKISQTDNEWYNDDCISVRYQKVLYQNASIFVCLQVCTLDPSYFVVEFDGHILSKVKDASLW